MKPDQLEERGTPYVNVKFTTSHKSPLWWLGGRVRTPNPMTPLVSYAPVTSDAVFRATL